jgi:molybdate/tungstate transport system substrate-binding protein
MLRFLLPFALAFLSVTAAAQTVNCAPPSNRQLVIYRAGSLTRAFTPLIKTFTCQTGIQVRDVALGSVDAARQITAGGQQADLYAPADYLDIDLFMKPAGYANFNIVFARGRMVLAYSVSGLVLKKLPPIAESASLPNAASKAVSNWVQILTMPGVTIGGGQPFLDPGAYRAPMIFQLAEAFYKVPNLYNNMLGHVVIAGSEPTAPTLGKGIDFQLTYEHTARTTANSNPDYRYVELPDEINLSDPARDAYYRQHAIIVLPGLGTPQSARTVAIPGNHVAWGITLMNKAPDRDNAIKFLELLLSPAGTASLKENGPEPISPPWVSREDFGKIPQSLRTRVAKPRNSR